MTEVSSEVGLERGVQFQEENMENREFWRKQHIAVAECKIWLVSSADSFDLN